MLQCVYCPKRFTRKPHLLRHEQTAHSDARPYNCSGCGKRYARKDVLERHMRNCLKSGGAKSFPAYGKGAHSGKNVKEAKFRDPIDQNETALLVGRDAANEEGRNGPQSSLAEPSVYGAVDSEDAEYGSDKGGMATGKDWQHWLFLGDDFQDFGSLVDVSLPFLPSDLDFEALAPDVVQSVPERTIDSQVTLPFTKESGRWPTAYDPVRDDSTSFEAVQGQQLSEKVIEDAVCGRVKDLPSRLNTDTWQQVGSKIYYKLHGNNDCRSGMLFLSQLVSLYFSHFHPSWPLLHEGSFILENSHPFLVLNVVSLGLLFLKHERARTYASSLHNKLQLDMFSRLKSQTDLTLSLDLTRAFLLNQVFSVYEANRKALYMAQIVSGVLVAFARRIYAFENTLLSESNNKAKTGEERLKNWLAVESRRRLAFAIIQIECALSALFNQPPSITWIEFDISLPCDEAIWQARTFSEWDSLVSNDKTKAKIPFSDIFRVMLNPSGVLPPLSTSDFKSILCALQEPIWRSNRHRTAGEESAAIGMNINGYQIDIDAQTRERNNLVLTLEKVRNAIMIMDSESESTAKSNTMILWHFCVLRLHSDLNALQDVAGRGYMRNDALMTINRLKDWAQGKSSRIAVWHAFDILEDAGKMQNVAVDPFISIALFESALVIWAMTSLSTRSMSASVHFDPVNYASFLSCDYSLCFRGIVIVKENIGRIMKLYMTALDGFAPIWKIANRLSLLLDRLGQSSVVLESYRGDQRTAS